MAGTGSDRQNDGHGLAEQHSPKKLRVVILEDDELLVRLYVVCLTKAFPLRFQTQAFTDGDEAWKELSQTDPDLLITDLQHPGLDGWQLLGLLAEQKKKYHILMISGEFQKDMDSKSFFPELNLRMMAKPAKFPELTQYLSALLGISSGGRWLTSKQSQPPSPTIGT